MGRMIKVNGFFGEPGTYGERDNIRTFGHMRQTIERLSDNVALMVLELHIQNKMKQYENDWCRYDTIAPLIELADKLMEEKLKHYRER